MSTRQCGPKYRTFVESFLDWMGSGYEEIFSKYLEAKRSTDPRDAAQITGKVMAFYRELRSRGLSPGYSKNHVKAIISFYAENGVVLELTKAQRKEMPKHGVKEKDLFTKSEIQQLLGATTHPRNRALIHILKDSGMAVSDAADLNVGDVKRALDNGDKFTQLEYRRKKTDVSGSPCLGPEALDSLRDWMRWRTNNGIRSAPDDPLFTGIRGEKTGERLAPNNLGDVVGYMIEKAGLTDKQLSAHGLRIFNASMLESAGVNRNVVYRLQGRLIPDSGRVYSKGEVLSSYMKAYEALAVGPRPQIIEIQDSRVAELEAKNAELDAKYERLRLLVEAIGKDHAKAS